MPICTKCDADKSRGDFYTDRGARTSACKICIKAQVALRYHTNSDVREAAKATTARWVANNPAKRQEASLKYVRNPANRDTYNATYNRRRARLKGNGGSYTVAEWRNLLVRYSNKCLRCGHDDKPLTADHVIPVSKGGSGSITNIQPLCGSCNFKKGTKTTDYRGDYAERREIEEKPVRVLSKAVAQQ